MGNYNNKDLPFFYFYLFIFQPCARETLKHLIRSRREEIVGINIIHRFSFGFIFLIVVVVWLLVVDVFNILFYCWSTGILVIHMEKQFVYGLYVEYNK